MLVNNIDIATLNARLLTKDIQTANVITFDDWLRNAINPLYMGKQEQYKQIKIKLYIKDTNEENALNDMSNLVKQFERCTIKFDDLSFYYDCLIVSKTHTRVIIGVYNLEIELKSGYAYKPVITQTMTNQNMSSFNVDGNLPTPAYVIITPSANITSITVTGLSEDPIIIQNLLANTPIIIDGVLGLVTQSGLNKYADTNMWEFPILQPGNNTINIDNSVCTVIIQFNPKWV